MKLRSGRVVLNSLKKSFKYDIDLSGENNNTFEVKNIKFCITNGEYYIHEINYDFRVNLIKAINDVELFLSQPITREYFENYKNDTHLHNFTFEECIEKFNGNFIRGDLLNNSEVEIWQDEFNNFLIFNL